MSKCFEGSVPSVSRRSCLIWIAGIVFAGEPQAQTRYRNMSIETVAGRQVSFVNGAFTNYHRDGRLDGRYPDGSAFRGRWELGSPKLFSEHPQSIRILLDNGVTNEAFFLQEGEALFLVRRGPGGRDIKVRVKSIKPI